MTEPATGHRAAMYDIPAWKRREVAHNGSIQHASRGSRRWTQAGRKAANTDRRRADRNALRTYLTAQEA